MYSARKSYVLRMPKEGKGLFGRVDGESTLPYGVYQRGLLMNGLIFG
jgi:hypothetical protein